MNRPKLRFPEFRNAGEWTSCDLGSKTVKVGSGITPRGGDKTYKKSGRPFIRSQNVGWGELLLDDVVFIDDKTHASFISTEITNLDVLLNITGASIGRSAVADSRIVGGNVNQHVCIIRAIEEELNPVFLNQFLISQYGQSQIDSFQAGGNRQGLNFAQVRSFSIPTPPIVEEQIRVADCLSSIDELITTEAQKLDTLKAHKKGLMQQLFPAEGETVPKLRFPEFRDAGEWKFIRLGDVGEFKNGINFSADKKGNGTLTVDVLNMYGSGIEMKLDSLYRVDVDAKDYLLQDGDILFFRSSLKREGIGWSSLFRDSSEPVLFCEFLIRLRLKSFQSTNPEFLLHYLRSDFGRNKIISVSGTAAITNISQDSLKTIPALLPTLSEQQKIADCLSSIDELISAQTQKLATLKAHKKGLMQQLFPSLDETNQ